MKKTAFILFIATVFCSCTHRLVDFTVISSKNIPITEVGTEFKKATQRVKGVDKKWQILFIPGIPSMKEAIDKAIEQYPGAVALTDGVVYSKMWTCGLFGQNKFVVEGTPLYTQDGYDAYNNNGNYYNQPQQNNNRPQQFYNQPQQNNYNQPQQNYYQPQQNNVQQPQKVSGLFVHEVKKGEDLEQIAKKYGVTMRDIIKWNNLTSTNLPPGTKLQIQLK